MTRRGRLLLLALVPVLLPLPAAAHSYRDPALRTVLDDVHPALPAGAAVAIRPSVLDELVVTNTTAVPLEVLGAGGRPFLRVSRDGVLADLGSPDWLTTAVPEGAPPPSPGRVRWVRVSRGSTWSEFDPRLRPPVAVDHSVRAAGIERVVAVWSIPLRYGGRPVRAAGRVVFSPVRGGLVVAVTSAPAGLSATALQGELPGLFVRVARGHRVEVRGADGGPFLRLAGGQVDAALASPSWRADRAARGLVVSGAGWARVGTGATFTWLDARLRYPHDEPPADQRQHQVVLQRWSVPALVDGVPGAIRGTVTWVPRAQALGAVLPPAPTRHRRWAEAGAVAVAVGAATTGWYLRRRRRRPWAVRVIRGKVPGEQS